jgi:hypothetical protein
MKQLFLFGLLAFLPVSASAQSFVNPDTIYQAGDIYLQNTDVYYCPFAPPSDTDVRAYLSFESDVLRDPNGVGDFWRNYLAFTRDSILGDTHHCNGNPADSLGRYVVWQRFFTARDKPNHTHSDIIVGSNIAPPDTIINPGFDTVILPYSQGPVIVSKNEDVDFRASGTVKMENGFHVMPGAFFHAYQEPRWGPTVFSDDFDSTQLDQSKWHVVEGSGEGAECSTDSNVIMDTDYEATDGHVADVILREIPDSCACLELLPYWDREDTTCSDLLDPKDTLLHYKFSSATLMACPFPFNQADTPHTLVYQHIPYGKYEVREKLPHLIYHTNNWGGGGSGAGEWDMNESWNPGEVHQGLGRYYLFGPYKGVFKTIADTTYFISPSANWSSHWNQPTGIVIDNIFYEVGLAPRHNKDTVTGRTSTFVQGGFPASYVTSGDTVSFYYEHWPFFTADKVPWKIHTDSSCMCSVFSAPYHVIGLGDSLRFNKAYQPVTITIHVRAVPDSTATFNCRWDSVLNSGTDIGLLVLLDGNGNPFSLPSTDLHTFTEAYPFALSDYGTRGTTGEIAQTQIDTLGISAHSDSVWATTPYKYHTFSMERLPNEIRFLVDSNVVRRFPDHMLPPGNPYFDWAARTPRGPEPLQPAEFFIESVSDPRYAGEKAFFEAHDTTCSGCKDITIGGHTYHAAHQKVDYVKIWDVPADVKIPNFTR